MRLSSYVKSPSNSALWYLCQYGGLVQSRNLWGPWVWRAVRLSQRQRLSSLGLHDFQFDQNLFVRCGNSILPSRYRPLVEMVSMKLLPKKLPENVQDHHQLSLNKVRRRLNLEQQRREFETPVIELNTDVQEMSLPDIQSIFSHLILAGS